tara:strand:- start:61 stop:699 length:639 start_codon:yes stop_codon:yes gene_type:complete
MAPVIQNFKMNILNRTDITKLSLTNQYQVNISGITGALKDYLKRFYSVDNNYLNGATGIMCSEATLPTSSFATAEVKDNFQGINQQFAHTRMYLDSDFTFYVDLKFNVLKFFEGWMDYISGDDRVDGVNRTDSQNYYRRFNYPMQSNDTVGYKCGSLTITKFDRNYENVAAYEFINAFPKAMTSIPVSYGDADILRVTVQFAYDRYVMGGWD